MRAESEQCPPANDPASESRASRRRFGWCVLAIVVLAAGLRLWSLDHGLPYSYYADESHFVKRSLAFGSGDLNPHWYHKPAFFMYALFFEYGVYFLFGKVVGWWSSPTAFAHHYFEDPGMFYALGRATASLAGVGVVLVTIFAARRLAGPRAGLIAGLFLATNFCLAEAGRWVKADVPCTLFTVLAAYWLIRVAESGRRRHYWFAGLAVGVGTATKYYALTVVPVIWLVHWARRRGKNETVRALTDRRPWEAMAAAFLAFFLCSPYNVLDFPTWWNLNLGPRIDHILTDKLGVSILPLGFLETPNFVAGAYGFTRCLLSAECMGLVWGLLGLLGLVYQITRPRREAWVPLLCVAPFVLMAILWNPIGFEPRYLSVLLPILAMAAAQLLAEGWTTLRQRWTFLRNGMGGLVVLVLVVPGTLRIVDWNLRHARQDTRTVAARWIEENIPAGTRILNDNDWVKIHKNEAVLNLEWAVIQNQRAHGLGGAFLNQSRDYQYRYSIAAARNMVVRGVPTYWSWTLHHPWWFRDELAQVDGEQEEQDLDMGTPWRRTPLLEWEVRSQGIRYIVTTSKTYNQYRPDTKFKDWKNWLRFYRWVQSLPLVYTVPHQPEVRPGPTVRIHMVTP